MKKQFIIISCFLFLFCINGQNQYVINKTNIKAKEKVNYTYKLFTDSAIFKNKIVKIASPKPVVTIESNIVHKVDSNKKSEIDILLKKNAQKFIISSDKDTLIYCEEGTKILINANSFISERTKQPINGIIEFYVTEYYKMSDIILANLSTRSGNNIIETGGMLEVIAFSNNEKCLLKNDKPIEINFPTKTKKEGMSLYNGIFEKENHINWNLDKTNFNKSISQPFMIVEQMPEFPGGISELMSFIKNNIMYQYKTEKDGIEATVIVQFVIDNYGKINNIRILKGAALELDNAAIDVVKKMPVWIPGKQNGINVSVYYQLPIRFYIDKQHKEKLTWKGKPIVKYLSESEINKIETQDLNYYIFYSTNLGWINCDRLWKDNKKKINYVVTNENNLNSDAKVNIIFHRVKSVLEGNFKNAKFIFNSVPLDENITIVAIIIKDNKPFLAIKDANTSTKLENNLIFKPVTPELLKEEIKKLDKFN